MRRFETFIGPIMYLHGGGAKRKTIKEMKKCVSKNAKNASNENKENSDELYTACEIGRICQIAEEYITSCKACEKSDVSEGASSKKKTAKFPNLAGFCRDLGISRERYERLSKKYPEEFGKLEAILEDEALNSDISASVLTTYLKLRLGYNDTEKSEKTELDTGQMRLVFEHDLLSDGE